MSNKWNEQYSIRIYELSKAGHSQADIARVFKVDKMTVQNWISRHSLCKYAFVAGRKLWKEKTSGNKTTFLDYVYKKLPKKYRRLWKKLKAMETKPTGTERINAMLEKAGERARQNLFIHAYVSSNFRLLPALQRTRTKYSTFMRWKEKDPDFPGLLDFIHQLKGDFFEDALCNQVALGDAQIIKFVNQTYNRDRGYDDSKLKLDVKAEVENKSTVKVEALNLPIDIRQQILERVRQVKQIESSILEQPKALPVAGVHRRVRKTVAVQ